MSVILKGHEIQIPNSCDVCSFCGCDFTCMNYTADCFGEDISDYEMCRHSKCNLVEIPDGAMLIDANKLISLYSDRMEKVVERYGIDSSEAGVLSGAMKLLQIQPNVFKKEESE